MIPTPLKQRPDGGSASEVFNMSRAMTCLLAKKLLDDLAGFVQTPFPKVTVGQTATGDLGMRHVMVASLFSESCLRFPRKPKTATSTLGPKPTQGAQFLASAPLPRWRPQHVGPVASLVWQSHGTQLAHAGPGS